MPLPEGRRPSAHRAAKPHNASTTLSRRSGSLPYNSLDGSQPRIQRIILRTQRFDLRLLLLDGVDEDDVEAVVPDALNLAFTVGEGERRSDFRNLLRGEAQVGASILFPVETDWL